MNVFRSAPGFPSTRRSFLRRGAQATVFSFVAPDVLGLHGATPPSGKLSLACIGVGGRGRDDLESVKGENVVALCDVDTGRCAAAAQLLPGVRQFQDFRKMLEAVGREIDAVVVATPDHTHAVAVLAALELGKHVFCEKPLGHSLHEVRQMTEVARRRNVITQLGNQGHSFASSREFVEMIQAGAIGTVREVHARCRSVYRPREYRLRPPDTPPVPPNLNWDVWLGPAAYRPYHPTYLPGRWRNWVPFGTGVIGDWTCHVIDPVFWALDLGAPTSVMAEADDYLDPRIRAETFPAGSVIRYEFPERGGRPGVKLTWYDGSRVPPRPPELEPGKELPGIGAIVIGDKGKIIYGSHGAAGARLIPEAQWQAYQKPAPTIPRSPGQAEEWIAACKGGPRPGSTFSYGGPLTEIALLGVMALRFPRQKLLWDSGALAITNHREADALVRPESRKGWKI